MRGRTGLRLCFLILPTHISSCIHYLLHTDSSATNKKVAAIKLMFCFFMLLMLKKQHPKLRWQFNIPTIPVNVNTYVSRLSKKHNELQNIPLHCVYYTLPGSSCQKIHTFHLVIMKNAQRICGCLPCWSHFFCSCPLFRRLLSRKKFSLLFPLISNGM